MVQMMEKDKSGDPSKRKLHFSTENPEILNFTAYIDPNNEYGVEDRLSQINALQQIIHVASHGFIQDYILAGRLNLHVLWFDVYKGTIL
jgi:carbonic anhydrase